MNIEGNSSMDVYVRYETWQKKIMKLNTGANN